jgi:hypothetical protein
MHQTMLVQVTTALNDLILWFFGPGLIVVLRPKLDEWMTFGSRLLHITCITGTCTYRLGRKEYQINLRCHAWLDVCRGQMHGGDCTLL